MAYPHNQGIRSWYTQMRSRHSTSSSLKLSVNRASTILCIASCTIQGVCYGMYPYSKYWQPFRQYCVCHYCYPLKWAPTEHRQSINTASTAHQHRVNRVSTILGVASCVIQGLSYGMYPKSTYWQPWSAKEIMTWSQPQSESGRQQSLNGMSIEHQQSVNTASTARQQRVNRASTECYQRINRASTQRQQSVNRVSMILGVASCIIHGLCYGIYSELPY